MKYPKGVPLWVGQVVQSKSALTDTVQNELGGSPVDVAQKLAAAPSLLPLWRAIDKHAANDSFFLEFFGSAGEGSANYFKHLVKMVWSALEPPTGYSAMSPAKLDEWRKRTQGHALKLLGDLMDGYPEIEKKEDEAFLHGNWVMSAAMHIATKGAESHPGKLIQLLSDNKLDQKLWASGYAVTARLPMILRYLIEWLDSDVAKSHTVTHAASRNVHRNSFIRQITEHFEQFFDTPMRKHVFCISALFFEMEGMTESDIKKLAPARRGGGLPSKFLKNLPG